MIALLACIGPHSGSASGIDQCATRRFRGCLQDAAARRLGAKVSAEGIETYLRSACTGQMGTLKDCDCRVRHEEQNVEEGSIRGRRDDDRRLMLRPPLDNYKFMAGSQNASAATAAGDACGRHLRRSRRTRLERRAISPRIWSRRRRPAAVGVIGRPSRSEMA